MDLENELRLAMAEHVADATVGGSLATAVRERHRRRVARRRVALVTAAVGLLATAMAPAYQALRATPAGDHRPLPPSPGGTAVPHAPVQVQPTSPGTARPAPSAGPSGTSQTPVPSATAPAAKRPSPPPGLSWIGYLPSGLKAVGACVQQSAGVRRTTVCRWNGSGTLEVDVIRAPGLVRAEQLGALPVIPRYVTVHGNRAIYLVRPDGGSQLVWIDRPGVGVIMIAGPSLSDQLTRIAAGIRP